MALIPWGAQLYIGRGLNSQTGAVHGSGLEYDSPQTNPGVGFNTDFRLESITSSRELRSHLSVSATASFAGAWGASAAVDLSEEKEINSYYVYALMKCRVTKPAVTLRNPRLKPEAQTLLQQRGWDAFATSYGWEYVDGYVPGGSYFGLIEIQTSTEREQRNVKTKLGGYYGPFSASAEFQHTLEEIQKQSAINVTVARSGGAGIVQTSIEEMLKEAKEFPLTVESNPVEMSALTASYINAVPLPPMDPPTLPQQQEDTIADLGKHYIRLRDYRANLEFILSRPLAEFDQFRTFEDNALSEHRARFRRILDKVLDEIDEVSNRARSCARNSSQCESYSPDVEYIDLPTIEGELLNLKQMEEKMLWMEQALQSHGLFGGPIAMFDGDIGVKGQVTVGTNGNARLRTRHIDGKAATSDAPDWLVLNWDNGQNVQLGGAQRSNLDVYGNIHAVEGKVHTRDMHAQGDLYITGKIGTNGRHPNEGLGDGIGGGVHTWDVVADGGVYVGKHIAMYSDTGHVSGAVKKFVIDHPLDPKNMNLVHTCLEGPEIAVYYRGEAVLKGNVACVELPQYFEVLTHREGRTVLVTPIFEDSKDHIVALAASPVQENHFFVRSVSGEDANQRFYWEVKGVRADVGALVTETPKQGPDNS